MTRIRCGFSIVVILWIIAVSFSSCRKREGSEQKSESPQTNEDRKNTTTGDQIRKQRFENNAPLEQRIIVDLPFRNTVDELGSLTIHMQPGLDITGPAGSKFATERPGDTMPFRVGNIMTGDTQPSVYAAEGSEIRISGYARKPFSLHVPKGKRLCFKKCKGGWVYLCGVGSIRDEYFGKNRTANSCLALVKSSDQILREGAIRDLGRLTEGKDYPRVIECLRKLVQESNPTIRRAAAEALGTIGRKECVQLLKSSLAAESNSVTKAFFSEALALCGGSVLLGLTPDSQLGKSEAVSLFVAGRNAWVDDVLRSRLGGSEDEVVKSLISMLESPDPNEKIASAVLLGALKASGARDAIKKLANNDPSKEVRTAAKAAQEEIDRYVMELLMRFAK